jgi:hypothetical protein
MIHGERSKILSWEATMKPASNPPMSKEYAIRASLNVLKNALEFTTWVISRMPPLEEY